MKKVHTLAMLGIPLFLAAGFLGTRTTSEEAQQQQQVRGPSYHFESQHFAMQDAGTLLERLGREIQQNNRITVGGNTYPVTGFGGIEFSVSARGERTGLELGFGSSGRTTAPTGDRPQDRDYDPYQRGGRFWAPADVANVVAELAQTLDRTGAFVMEDHRVSFSGAARIDQRLVENTAGRQQPYELEVHVLFGEGESGPDDDEDYGEDQESGLIRSLARVERAGANQGAVTEVFTTIAENLQAGRVRIGDQDLAVGEIVHFGLTHVTAANGDYDKIEFNLRFGPVPPPRSPDEARYGDEAFNEPLADLAAILQRMAAQILEDGTFELDGQTFTASRTANWEFGASQRGFSVEVSFRQPPGQR